MRTELTMTELEAVNGGGFTDWLKDAWETVKDAIRLIPIVF